MQRKGKEGATAACAAAAPLRAGAGGGRGWTAAAAAGDWGEGVSGAGEVARRGKRRVGWGCSKMMARQKEGRGTRS